MQPIGMKPSFNFNTLVTAGSSITDPKNYADFKVTLGEVSSSNGILGGVLDQEDYDKFTSIIKDFNIMDASHNEINLIRRQLTDAGLMTHEVSSTMAGPAAFIANGEQDYNKKYNQLGYQQELLPRYAGKEYNQVRSNVIDAFKIVTAIAEASPSTGKTVSQDTYFNASADTHTKPGITVNISEFAQQLATQEADNNRTQKEQQDLELELIQLAQSFQLTEEVNKDK